MFNGLTSMESPFRSAFVNCLGSFFTALILLHALITGPLLVLCMPADGRCLIEFVGHDPCHHFKVVQSNCDRSTKLACEEDADTCVDLMMDSPGIAQAGLDFVSLPTSCVIPELADSGDCVCDFLYVPEVYKPAREPVILPAYDPRCDCTLRI